MQIWSVGKAKKDTGQEQIEGAQTHPEGVDSQRMRDRAKERGWPYLRAVIGMIGKPRG